ncbi:hypothetical protein MUK42_35482 [Musa troglodytarum]|uniref:Uncharacterized protein n=1 Tax=Musa troglodytarum TaxID=320322 RepID=A0A9E7FNS2_9LILI|nr:hypothetical protein MUK42_35482 [Musa troglodytarum]
MECLSYCLLCRIRCGTVCGEGNIETETLLALLVLLTLQVNVRWARMAASYRRGISHVTLRLLPTHPCSHGIPVSLVCASRCTHYVACSRHQDGDDDAYFSKREGRGKRKWQFHRSKMEEIRVLHGLPTRREPACGPLGTSAAHSHRRTDDINLLSCPFTPSPVAFPCPLPSCYRR